MGLRLELSVGLGLLGAVNNGNQKGKGNICANWGRLEGGYIIPPGYGISMAIISKQTATSK